MSENISKKIEDLLVGIDKLKTVGNLSTEISSIHFDSRSVLPNSLFIAVSGNNLDGKIYISKAIANGAKAIVYDGELSETSPEILYIQVSDTRVAQAIIAKNFYDDPSSKLKLVGVTGTNGKTTTATVLYELFKLLGYKVALLSTIENKINDEVFETSLTTPDSITITAFLDNAVKAGCQYAFMECSSHAIDQKRIYGLNFAGCIFTNLSQDHLDYHKTMDAYAESKKRLFDELRENSFALSNLDDERGEYMLEDTKASKYYFSINIPKADFFGKVIDKSITNIDLIINNKESKINMIGQFNIYNILGVFGTAKLLGISEEKILSLLPSLNPPKGRLQFIESSKGDTKKIYGVVDYSHTPDSLFKAIETLRDVSPKSSKIITVVGCGGDRDKTKRPIMGKIAYEKSDFAVFTSDNPRSEDPEQIISDITLELPKDESKYIVEVDRANAIKSAVQRANAGDIVLVAGKGHEAYQIFSDKTVHFSDIEEIQKVFDKLNK